MYQNHSCDQRKKIFNVITISRLIIEISAFSILFFMGCRESPGIAGFDSDLWIGDKSGCTDIRSGLAGKVIDAKENLMGQKENQIIRVLGKPDRSDLYKRNQKFFIYYLEPGPGCPDPVSSPGMLVIRFNATGYCNEVFLQRGFSTR
jgi:hypothetical protein